MTIVARACCDGAIHQQDIIVKNAGVFHGLATHPKQKGGLRMFDQLRHQVHTLYRMVISWRRKASRHPARQNTDQRWQHRERDGVIERRE